MRFCVVVVTKFKSSRRVVACRSHAKHFAHFRAHIFLRLAAEKGNSLAHRNLEHMCKHGFGVENVETHKAMMIPAEKTHHREDTNDPNRVVVTASTSATDDHALKKEP